MPKKAHPVDFRAHTEAKRSVLETTLSRWVVDANHDMRAGYGKTARTGSAICDQKTGLLRRKNTPKHGFGVFAIVTYVDDERRVTRFGHRRERKRASGTGAGRGPNTLWVPGWIRCKTHSRGRGAIPSRLACIPTNSRPASTCARRYRKSLSTCPQNTSSCEVSHSKLCHPWPRLGRLSNWSRSGRRVSVLRFRGRCGEPAETTTNPN